MTLRDAFLLGRVSNLPTVWSNALAGAVLAGAVDLRNLWIAIAALSLFYVGGMYLNDAFDRDHDARARPERPIPSGKVEARTVFIAGFGMLIAGVLLLGIADRSAAIAGLALALLIVLYDVNHKGNPASPALMGLCRADVYVCSALAIAGSLSLGLMSGALLLFGHVVGLTYVAKRETTGGLSKRSAQRAERAESGARAMPERVPVLSRWPSLLLYLPIGVAMMRFFDHPLVLAFAVAHFLWIRRSLSFIRTGDIPGAVVRLIAGIALLDAMLLASQGAAGLALIAVACCWLTRLLQRSIPGT